MNAKTYIPKINNVTLKTSNQDIIKMLEQEGVTVKEERGHRIFPVTDKSKDVLDALLRILKKQKVEIKTNARVDKILVNEQKVTGVQFSLNGKQETVCADKVILATGGKSYPSTGSTGDGYEIARKLGHKITPPKASLVGLVSHTNWISQLQGLSLKNVQFRLLDSKNREIY